MVVVERFGAYNASRWFFVSPKVLGLSDTKKQKSPDGFYLQFCPIPSRTLVAANLAQSYLQVLLSAWGQSQADSLFNGAKMARIIASSSYIVNAYLQPVGKNSPEDEANLVGFLLSRTLSLKEGMVDFIRFIAVRREQQYLHLGGYLFQFWDNQLKGNDNRFISASVVSPAFAGLVTRRKHLLGPNINTQAISESLRPFMLAIANEERACPEVGYDLDRGVLLGDLGRYPSLCWRDESSVPWDRDPQINSLFRPVLFPSGTGRHDGSALLMLWR